MTSLPQAQLRASQQAVQCYWLSRLQSWRLGTTRKQREQSYRGAGGAGLWGFDHDSGGGFLLSPSCSSVSPVGSCPEPRGNHWYLPGPKVQDKAGTECGVPFSESTCKSNKPEMSAEERVDRVNQTSAGPRISAQYPGSSGSPASFEGWLITELTNCGANPSPTQVPW